MIVYLCICVSTFAHFPQSIAHAAGSISCPCEDMEQGDVVWLLETRVCTCGCIYVCIVSNDRFRCRAFGLSSP